MEQRLSLVTLGVRGLTKARALYEALGWSGAVQPGADIYFFQLGGMVFAHWSELGGHGAPGLELAYNEASEAEVQATLDEAVRAGGTILRQATLAAWEEHRERLQMLMVTSGGLRTTQGGACWKMGPFASR